MLLTVLTPTYNRARLLSRCYQSLISQTYRDFEWLVVDDGSTDNTGEIIRDFQEMNKLKIRYLYQQNGGKHTALNTGVKAIQTELTLILDSDDFLTADAVQSIAGYYEKYKVKKGLCAFVFLKINKEGHSLAGKLPAEEFTESYIECRINGHIGGDMAEVFFTHCLKEFPFPQYPNERFISEDIVWIPMGLKYKMVFINKSIYCADYLEDGLTHSGRPMKIRSPLGGMERAKMLMIKQCALSCRIKGVLLYICYGKFANQIFHDLFVRCSDPALFLVLYPFGSLLHFVWSQKYA